MFEKYKAERNLAYKKLLSGITGLSVVFIIVLMIYTCIFYASAKPLFLLILAVVIGLVGLGTDEKSFTKDNPDLYYHNGGLFFISYAQFIDEENKKCETKLLETK